MRLRRRPARHCLECGEELTGGQRQWCGNACAARVYRRARTIALDHYAPLPTHCLSCNAPLSNRRFYCSTQCRKQSKYIAPSRYDNPDFLRKKTE